MDDLATFDDRLTMRHERVYPHPITRVFDAVSTTEHLDVWMLPASQVERREGGRCSFSWGGPADQGQEGMVEVFDPPSRVRYRFGEGGYIEFALEARGDDETHLTFIQCFAPGVAVEQAPDAAPGWDQPAGPDSPWRPGFVAGFHGFLDQLDDYLAGRWTRERAAPFIETVYANGDALKLWEEHPEARPPANDPDRHGKLIDVYRKHIRDTIPG